MASELLSAPASATAAGRGSSAGAIAGTGHGLTSNSTAFCPSLPHEFWHGRGPPGSGIHPGVSVAAVRPLGAEVVVVAAAGAGDGAPFVGLPLLRRPSPSEWGCSYLVGRSLAVLSVSGADAKVGQSRPRVGLAPLEAG